MAGKYVHHHILSAHQYADQVRIQNKIAQNQRDKERDKYIFRHQGQNDGRQRRKNTVNAVVH